MNFRARSIGLMAALAATISSPAASAPRMLETDIGRAARTCWFATMTSAGEQPPADTNADGIWFLIEAARKESRGGDSMARVQQIAGEEPGAAYFNAIAANAADLKRQCTTRWPKSARSSPAALPKVPFDRDLMCYALASLVSGMADREKKVRGSSFMFAIVNPILARSEKSLSETELAKRGFSTQEQVDAALSRAVFQAQSLGNLNTLLSRCLFG